MSAATIQNLIADIGAEFKLELLHKDSLGVIIDYSAGWSARFVLMDGFGGLDIEDTTSVVLTDGTSGVNVSVSIGKTSTSLWNPTKVAKYEMQVWPTASPELVKILFKGDMTIREGLV